MKKNLLSFLFLLLTSPIFAQNAFQTKKKTSTGEAIKDDFPTISAKKLGVNLPAKMTLVPTDLDKRVVKDEDSDAIIYINNPTFTKLSKNAKKSQAELTMDFLSSVKTDLKVKNPSEEFRLVADEKDEYGIRHIKLEQKYKGIPLYGGESILHSDKTGAVSFLAGKVFPTPNIGVTASINPLAAIDLCLKDLAKTTIIQKSGAVNKFISLDPDKAELFIISEDNKTQLAYNVTVRPNILERWVYFIDANTGEVISKFNHTCTLDGVVVATAKDLNAVTKSFNVTQVGFNYFMIDPTKKMFKSASSSLPDKPVGAVWTIDAQNSTADSEEMNLAHVSSTNKNSWSPTAVSAHINASICYDYYNTKFSRNSLNGNGGNIISVINITDENGKGMDNAYWNGQFMGYGNGKDAFKPLAGALDVAGHEMTHGVVENTAKLEYRNQSGALNESFADIFGALIDREDWLLGEDVVKTSVFPSGALRSLENPNQGGKNDPGYQPKTMSQYQFLRDTPSEDNGGVHINSGIPNFAFYKFATGAGMLKDKAEKVYYQALTKYLTRTSKFQDLRIAVIQSAKDIYGDGSEVAAAKAAFDAVGITDASTTGTGSGGTGGSTGGTGSTSKDNTIPVNPGALGLVVFDPRESDQSLYAGPYGGAGDIPKIANAFGCLSKPSITDDGNFVYFVGKDNHIYQVDLIKKTAPVKLSNSASWRNVAISKDGKQLAALASKTDNFIYVFDLVNNKNTKFELYNPTYTKGVSTGEVKYADSFEWDYSGEFIVYDAFNVAKSAFKDIEFWDVGIIRVWDPIKKAFSDGVIEKMFTNLGEGDNIGNPALAKTNTGIYAFDYFSNSDNQFYVLTIDFGLSANNVQIIEKNNAIGYPDFSKNDDKLVFNAVDGNTYIVKNVTLKSDKITPNGASTVLFTDAKWAVWYASGSRALPTKEAQVITISAIADKAPKAAFDISASTTSKLSLVYTVVSGDAAINGKTVTLGNTPGKVTIRAFQVGDSKYAGASADVTFCISPPTPTLKDNGTTITASGGSLYQFFVNNGVIGGFTSNPTLKKDFVGAYTVSSVTSDGCYSGISNAIGVSALGLEPTSSMQVLVMPNPVEDQLNVKIPDGEVFKSLKILDNTGREVFESKISNPNIKQMTAGQYLLKVVTDANTYPIKMIKK